MGKPAETTTVDAAALEERLAEIRAHSPRVHDLPDDELIAIADGYGVAPALLKSMSEFASAGWEAVEYDALDRPEEQAAVVAAAHAVGMEAYPSELVTPRSYKPTPRRLTAADPTDVAIAAVTAAEREPWGDGPTDLPDLGDVRRRYRAAAAVPVPPEASVALCDIPVLVQAHTDQQAEILALRRIVDDMETGAAHILQPFVDSVNAVARETLAGLSAILTPQMMSNLVQAGRDAAALRERAVVRSERTADRIQQVMTEHIGGPR